MTTSVSAGAGRVVQSKGKKCFELESAASERRSGSTSIYGRRSMPPHLTDVVERAIVRALVDIGLQPVPPGRTHVAGVVFLELQRPSPAAAGIVANVEEDGSLVTLVFGVGTVLEIPPGGGRYTDLPMSEEIHALCSAVVRGALR